MWLRKLVHGIAIVTLTVVFLGIARPASAQGMDLSVWADTIWDGDTIFGWIDGYDNSWGCEHSDYSAFSGMWTPTRYVSGDGYLSLPFAGDEGDWGMEGGISFHCSCIFSYYQAPITPINFVVRLLPTFVRRIGTQSYVQGPPAPWAFIVNREILDQWQRPLADEMFVDEIFSPDPPSGNCTSEMIEQGDAWSDPSGLFGPDFYILPGGAPNPCSSSSQQRYVIYRNGIGYSVFTRYNITWQYSGLILQAQQEP